MPSPSVDSPPEPVPALRILAVDDHRGSAKLLAKLLRSLGPHEVEIAHDGTAALNTLNRFAPHLVLLDIGLPGMDGYEVAKAIRADRRYDGVLLAALTGYKRPQDIRKSEEAGFDLHLIKPPAMDELRELLTHPKLMNAPPEN